MNFEPTIEVNPDTLMSKLSTFMTHLRKYRESCFSYYQHKSKDDATHESDRIRVTNIEKNHLYQDSTYKISAVASSSFFFPVLDEKSFIEEVSETLDYTLWKSIDEISSRIKSEIDDANNLLVDLKLISSYSKSMLMKLPELRAFEYRLARLSDIEAKISNFILTEKESAKLETALS